MLRNISANVLNCNKNTSSQNVRPASQKIQRVKQIVANENCQQFFQQHLNNKDVNQWKKLNQNQYSSSDIQSLYYPKNKQSQQSQILNSTSDQNYNNVLSTQGEGQILDEVAKYRKLKNTQKDHLKFQNPYSYAAQDSIVSSISSNRKANLQVQQQQSLMPLPLNEFATCSSASVTKFNNFAPLQIEQDPKKIKQNMAILSKILSNDTYQALEAVRNESRFDSKSNTSFISTPQSNDMKRFESLDTSHHSSTEQFQPPFEEQTLKQRNHCEIDQNKHDDKIRNFKNKKKVKPQIMQLQNEVSSPMLKKNYTTKNRMNFKDQVDHWLRASVNNSTSQNHIRKNASIDTCKQQQLNSRDKFVLKSGEKQQGIKLQQNYLNVQAKVQTNLKKSNPALPIKRSQSAIQQKPSTSNRQAFLSAITQQNKKSCQSKFNIQKNLLQSKAKNMKVQHRSMSNLQPLTHNSTLDVQAQIDSHYHLLSQRGILQMNKQQQCIFNNDIIQPQMQAKPSIPGRGLGKGYLEMEIHENEDKQEISVPVPESESIIEVSEFHQGKVSKNNSISNTKRSNQKNEIQKSEENNWRSYGSLVARSYEDLHKKFKQLMQLKKHDQQKISALQKENQTDKLMAELEGKNKTLLLQNDTYKKQILYQHTEAQALAEQIINLRTEHLVSQRTNNQSSQSSLLHSNGNSSKSLKLFSFRNNMDHASVAGCIKGNEENNGNMKKPTSLHPAFQNINKIGGSLSKQQYLSYNSKELENENKNQENQFFTSTNLENTEQDMCDMLFMTSNHPSQQMDQQTEIKDSQLADEKNKQEQINRLKLFLIKQQSQFNK